MTGNMNAMDVHLKIKSMPSLCFNKDDFISNEFRVDKFVSDCRRFVSLDTMRDDLNLYNKMLCTAMIELLNKHYADFVNLSSNLAGLDKSIKSLSLPLQSLKKEIEETKSNLDGTLNDVTKMFSERAANHNSKVLIHHLLCVNEGLEKIHLLNSEKKHDNMEVLERIALKFNAVKFHMHEISDFSLKDYDSKKLVVAEVAKNLEQQLEDAFLHSLPNAISDNGHSENMHKILHIYSAMSEERKVEHTFRLLVVRPFMKDLITPNNITKFGLEKVLNDILCFIPTACCDILRLTRGVNKGTEIVPGYDFLVNAVWPEIIDSLQCIAPICLYSLGDPQQFHQNYSSTIKFLDQFEHLCEVQSSVMKLREQSSYKEFIQKFNLDVYFQIRFQEIAGKFENDLLVENLMKSNVANLPYILRATASLWTCLNLCWCDSIFLPPLKKDFWKLTVQVLFRYNKYANCYLEEITDKFLELAWLIKDIETLVPKLKIFFLDIVLPKLQCASIRPGIEVAIQEIVNCLNEIPAAVGEKIVKILTEKCTLHLKLIANIPQRFRKTNREIPSKPSPYVSQVLSPLSEFLLETNSVLPEKWSKFCETQVTDGIMKQCVMSMQDVLTSIKKMEDSLKILKRARDKPTGQFSSGVVTDDDKIRRQLAIDVTYFEELVEKSGFQVNDLKSFKELKDLVTSARKVAGFSTSS